MPNDDTLSKSRPGHFDRFTLFNLNVQGLEFRHLALYAHAGDPNPLWEQAYNHPVLPGTAASFGPPPDTVPEPEVVVYRYAIGNADQPDETIVAPPGMWLSAAQTQVGIELFEDYDPQPH